jgi:hypothetical protein
MMMVWQMLAVHVPVHVHHAKGSDNPAVVVIGVVVGVVLALAIRAMRRR